jgi:hypothetical protein
MCAASRCLSCRVHCSHGHAMLQGTACAACAMPCCSVHAPVLRRRSAAALARRELNGAEGYARMRRLDGCLRYRDCTDSRGHSECKPRHVHHATCGIRDATSNIIRRTYIRGTVPTQEQLLRALQQLGLQRQSTSRSVEHQTRLARSHGCPFQRRHCAARATATHCARSVGVRCSELRLQNIECRARQNLVDDRARQEGRYLARRVGDL